MIIAKHITCCIFIGAGLAAAAPLLTVQGPANPAGDGHAVRNSSAARRGTAEEEGQRVFEQNCARCHNAPDGFPSRITGTIVRHMRVRANLSQHDETVLLRYFNQ
jgi:cytochrome c5